jgi:DNA-binding LacI/PurR family transcriptional regulator
MMAGMSRAAVLGNLSIVAHQVPAHEMESILDPRRQPPAMRMGQVDGILVAQGWDAGVVEELRRGHAVVSVHERYEGCDFVGADLADAVVRLASEIPDRSPGFFCASSEAEEHLWEEICAAAGVRMGRPSVMDRLVTTSLADGKSASDSGAGSWQEKMGALASAGVRSWICADAASAKNLFGHLAAIGGCPPDVLAIVQPGPASGLPGNILRTGPDAGEIGMAAVRRLVRRIEMPDEPVRSILLQSKTVIREGQA